MKFTVFNSYSYVASATVSEDAWLRHVLSHNKQIKGYMGITKSLETITLFDPVERKFPTGTLPIIAQMALERGIDLFYEDKRVRPAPITEANLLFLHDDIRGPFQRAAIEAGLQWGRGIWHLPTGAGKTQVAIGIAKRVRCKWAFLVDETTLLAQARDRWNAWDFDEEPAGVLGEGQWRDARFVVATYQTLHSRMHEPEIQAWVLSVGGILPDECHVLAADTYYSTTMAFVNAYYRLGMSATPLSRGPWDNLRVMACLGRVIYKADVTSMVARGAITMPLVRWLETTHKMPNSATWQGIYTELVVENTPRNKLIAAATLAALKPALLFVRQIKHGEILLGRLLRLGLRAELLHGEAKVSERKAAIGRLTRGDIDVIVTNKIFQKGVDIPLLRSVIIGGGGQSVVDSLQQVGRGMRTATGKVTLDVYDVMDRGHDWLIRHSRERRKTYRQAGYLFENDVTPTLPFTPPR